MMPQAQQTTSAVGALAAHQDPLESAGDATAEAPPKQVALAMERLTRAARVIADIRLGADRLLEALFMAADSRDQSNSKAVEFILKEESSMRQHFQDLRALGSLFALPFSHSHSYDFSAFTRI